MATVLVVVEFHVLVGRRAGKSIPRGDIKINEAHLVCRRLFSCVP